MTDANQPGARHVEEPQKAMPLPDPRPELWENFTNYVGALLVCAKHNIAVIDALLAANRELAKEVERLAKYPGKAIAWDAVCVALGETCPKWLEPHDNGLTCAVAAIKGLAARADLAESRALAAQKDAERYRILWEQNEREHTTRDADCVISWNHGHDWAPVRDLDAAVDAIDAAAK